MRENDVLLTLALGLAIALPACGGDGESGAADAGPILGCSDADPPSRTVSCVASFTPGKGAGFGQDAFPDVIYGPPHGGGEMKGSTDVLSLGHEGEIVVGFGGGAITDGPGVDLLVFENAFFIVGDPQKPFHELAEVSVSTDGATWIPFPCRREAYPFEGCAGWHPVYATPESGEGVYDPEAAGGDPFDLADIGVAEARFVRVRDRGAIEAGDNAGFDLDAMAVVNGTAP